MIPQKEVKFKIKDYAFKVKKDKCYYCQKIDKALKDNPASLLKKIKISYDRRECDCGSATIYIYKKQNRKQKNLGHIVIDTWDRKTAQTHSRIQKSLRNKGFGIYLYALAADYCAANKINLRSSGGPSDMATRVWNSKRLRKYYTVKKGRYDGDYSIKPKKTTKLARL